MRRERARYIYTSVEIWSFKKSLSKELKKVAGSENIH
jgi:hypothetical protein